MATLPGAGSTWQPGGAVHPRLRVWEKAFELALELIRITNRLPKPEAGGMANEVRATAILLPAGLAAARDCGDRRLLWKELNRTQRTLSRLEIQILICAELGYLERTEILDLEQRVLEVRRLARRLLRKRRTPPAPPR